MRSAERLLAAAVLAAALGCGGGGSGLPDTKRNVVPVSVDGALCGTNTGIYVNEPCVAVTVCTPGTQTCQTIDGILLDTASFGLRIFKQLLTVSLAPVPAGAGELAECAQFGDLSADWGPVRMADVVLGGEPAVQIPIQVIDAGYAVPPASCPNPEKTPSAAGFNGILGVGAFAHDCGGTCTTSANAGLYFACSGSSCTGTAVPLAQQVTNPVAALPQDGNGVVVDLPAVPPGGAPHAEGAMRLGIGTVQNNVPGQVSVFALDGYGELRTSIGGTSYPSFLDTGSNGLFFPPPAGVALPTCASNPGWFCPPTITSLTATNGSSSGGGGVTVSFQIASLDQLSASNNVFSDIGGPSIPSGGFDWGLPFFLGRMVYVGIEGRISSIGTGPYVAH